MQNDYENTSLNEAENLISLRILRANQDEYIGTNDSNTVLVTTFEKISISMCKFGSPSETMLNGGDIVRLLDF
jgi:hypothetical protein